MQGKKERNGKGERLLLLGRGPGAEQVCLGPARIVWALDFVQERIHNISPDEYGGTFIKAGGSKTRKGLA